MVTRGKGEGSVYKRADGMWCVTVELPRGVDGKRRRKTIARKSKRAALDELDRVKGEMKAGKVGGDQQTVKEWFDYWLNHIVPASDARPSTVRGYRSAVNEHIIPELGRVRLTDLSNAHVRALDKRVTTTPKVRRLRLLDPEDLPEGTEYLTGAYSRNIFNVLRMGLNSAVAERVLNYNPLAQAKPPTTEARERRALDFPQAVQLLEHLAATDHPDRVRFMTHLYTGARRGEVAGLEVDRVGDLLEFTWQLQRISNISDAARSFEYRHLHGKLYLTRPKSKSGERVIPLVPPLGPMLHEYIGGRTEGLVFRGPDGLAENPDRITQRWRDTLADAGLPDDVVLHGARHTAVTLLYAAGVPEVLIKEIVGHSDIEMSRHYRTKRDQDRLREAMIALSSMLASPTARQIEA